MKTATAARATVSILLLPIVVAGSCAEPGDDVAIATAAIHDRGDRGGLGLLPEGAAPAVPTLVARAVLPAATFVPGPTSGKLISAGPINGQPVPFVDKQPVQGLSAALDLGNGRLLVMADNGYGAIENSADFELAAYEVSVDFETKAGGAGTVTVKDRIQFHDPYGKVPWAITNHFTNKRALTGADFDIESMQLAPDGTLWIGDEFGPFLLHFDRQGRLLDAPYRLPDFTTGGGAEVRSPQSPLNEEGSALRVMNAVRTDAMRHGNVKTPVFSPWSVLLKDNDPTTFVDSRQAPPPGSGVAAASSEIFDVALLQAAGYPVVTWTVDDSAQMTKLLALKVNGIISDRSDLLFAAVAAFDANGDGTAGDLLDADGLIDPAKFDAQGHRGSRDLRPENTIPAFEVALDNLMTTLELDAGITKDGKVVVDHDPHVQSQKCRRADGAAYDLANEVLLKDIRLRDLQRRYVCDKLFRGPSQVNDPALSPVSAAFMAGEGNALYAMPTLKQVFAFVDAYVAYYQTGAGAAHPDAARRAKNAARARFNIETKVNPRKDLAERTIDAGPFARKVAEVIVDGGLEDRADIQSFDFRTLLYVQKHFPDIRTVYLFGDFPVFADPTIPGSDDGTNLQDENGANTPWLAGLTWPYRVTAQTAPFRAQRSGGYEGMALSSDGKKLLALLELPLTGDPAKTNRISEFDLRTRRYTGVQYLYVLDARGTNIGDFIMTGPSKGLIIERDGSQGVLTGYKAIQEITVGAPGAAVAKNQLVDLINIADPDLISLPAAAGDVGLGATFSFPFTTIEDVIFLGGRRILVINDNNYPFSIGRHVGPPGISDDNEFIVVDVARPVSRD